MRLLFDRFELRPQERLLLADAQPVPLGARAFDVLLALVTHRKRVVTKAELLDLAWPGLVVEENNLTVQISMLRRVLGARSIVTVPARGYQFVAAVREDAVPVIDAVGGALPLARSMTLGQGCVLALRVERIAGQDAGAGRDVDADASAMAASVIREHEGLRLAGPVLAWWLPSARAGAACAHALHLRVAARAGSRTGRWAVALYRDQGMADAAQRSADAAAEVAARMAMRCEPGETWASSGVVGDLILSLDGDVEDLGFHDGLCAENTTRIFRLTPPPPAAQPPAAVARSGELRPTLAIIPFASYARDPGLLGIGDIIADQLIGALSRSHSINVISRLSTLPFRDRDNAVSQIARCLSADFVVSGRYLAHSGRVQVHVEVADASNARVLWSGSFVDSELGALQEDSELVQSLVAGITQAVFVTAVQRLRTLPLPDLATHTLLLAGISLMFRLSPRDFELARQALLTVSNRAPRHATPLAWLARWHLFRVVQGWSDDRDADGRAALGCAQRALELDPDSALAMTMLGNVATTHLKDLDHAHDAYEQALLLNPSESMAWLQKGNAHSFRGEGELALAHAQKAASLSPLDPARHYYLSILASAQLTAQDFAGATASARQSLRLNHEHVSTHRVLAIALAMSGRVDEARASVRQVLRLEPQLTVADYVARSPGAQSGLAQTFGEALRAAGLPPGPGVSRTD